jgi:hypothetical protein
MTSGIAEADLMAPEVKVQRLGFKHQAYQVYCIGDCYRRSSRCAEAGKAAEDENEGQFCTDQGFAKQTGNGDPR